MSVFRIQLFGQLAVYLDGQPLFVGIPSTKAFELFAYLLIHRRPTHPRETIATLLWPELTPQQARKNLRKVLCTLQHFLTGAVGTSEPPLLLIEHDWIALNPALDLYLDVAAFEQAYSLARQHDASRLDTRIAHLLTEAVALYEGELLTGLYTDWCMHERERLENMYLQLCHMLLTHAENRHAYELAIEYGIAILRHDRANERAHRDLMRLYYLSGNRSAALHQYDRCVVALASELRVRPRTCTEQLYRQICRDELVAAATQHDRDYPALPGEQRTDLSMRDHLQQIHTELQRTLKQVQDDIRYVERLLQR